MHHVHVYTATFVLVSVWMLRFVCSTRMEYEEEC